MSARAISSATISFGLVSIPVKVYASGESASAVRFNMLHRECGSRLKQQYVCAKHDKVVGREEMAKGFEFSKGQYVMFSEEELKAIEEKPTHAIDIASFLPTEKVDPVYFEKAYYLGPDKGGDRAYRLLTRALGESGRSALGQYAVRGKQYLVLLRPVANGIVMQQLRYADEVRSISEVPLGDAEVKPAELELALQIIEQGRTEEFRPSEFEDQVRKRALRKIEQKVQGREITVEPVETPKAQVIDLMEALKSSLRSGGRKPAKAATRETKASGRKKTAAKKARSS